MHGDGARVHGKVQGIGAERLGAGEGAGRGPGRCTGAEGTGAKRDNGARATCGGIHPVKLCNSTGLGPGRCTGTVCG